MEIILHVGAHRTATTSFQHYLRGKRGAFCAAGTHIWEPRQLRGGIFAGLHPSAGRAAGDKQRRAGARIRLLAAQLDQGGADRLLVSDENMIGSPRACLKSGALYPGIGERMARVSAAFGSKVTRIVFSVRSQDLWWASLAAYSVARGQSLPNAAKLTAIARNTRSWRDVITDLACAMPQAELLVLPFEEFASRPDKLAANALGCPVPPATGDWLHRSPDLATLRKAVLERGEHCGLVQGEGRWMPFDAGQVAQLREAYADDMMWLISGADGLATLTEDLSRANEGKTPVPEDMRGQSDDERGQGNTRRMA